MTEVKDINKTIHGSYYKIYFINPENDVNWDIYGEILNFNPCREVVIYNKKGIYIIPYESIVTMIPMPKPEELSVYYKEKFKLFI